MALALSRLSAEGWPRHVTPVGAESIVRFGDAVLILEDAPRMSLEAARRVSHGSVNLLSDAPVARLHLVVQIGRRFEIEHPDVPIVLSKGRYLIVDIDPAHAARLSGQGCYALRPLRRGETVFDVRRSNRTARAARLASVDALLSGISKSRLQTRLERLAAFPTRLSTSDMFVRAAAWARDEFASMGYAATLQKFSIGTGTSYNLIAERAGTDASSRSLFLITAHLDSVNSDGGPSAAAPGADDNGSGCVGVLELAALFASEHPEHDIRFVLFGGEEQGLYGSRHYLGTLSAADRQRIGAVINMDMIATRNGTPEPSVLIEGAPISRTVVDAMAETAGAYTGLTVQTSLNAFNSDHVPFIEAGLPAVLLIEGTDSSNGNVHTSNDTIQHVDYDLMSAIVTSHAAYVAARVGITGGAPMSIHDRPNGPGREESWRLAVRDGLIEALRALPFQFSGSYDYEGGVRTEGRRTRTGGTEPSEAALKNPIYRLEQPVFVEDSSVRTSTGRDESGLRFSLAIDIDGVDPLHVVSGAVSTSSGVSGTLPTHFIGRVSRNSVAPDGRTLAVTDFEFEWPNSANRITRLDIALTGSVLSVPTAGVTFVDVAQNRQFGPFHVQQRSRYYREVEVDIDRETKALNPEPLSTHIHPDRPGDLPESHLTLESAFADAGIRIARTVDTTAPITGAGSNHRWNYSELHDSMVLHWEAYANRPQWKMWILLAEQADEDGLGGVMFDGDIDEPGGVDRQGTALFTLCPFFHTPDGGYSQANPPAAEAARRELFFNLIHEVGHAFNLAHSFQKQLGDAYSAPSWMPLNTNAQALSWMNYPDSAASGFGPPLNASWFYRNFRYRFDDGELLFLRHAPERYVQMGAEAWFDNHARVSRDSVDPRLHLSVRVRRPIVEHGEPVLLELKLKNISDQPVAVHRNLDPSDGLVELAITNPKGERRPFLPFDHTRTRVTSHILQPGADKEAVYGLADVTMGAYGFHFKEPGAYRIEASYTNVDGRTAAAVLQIYVRPAASYDAVPAINELFDARIGRTLYVEGTRVQEDVNDKMDWIRQRLAKSIGERNPIDAHLKLVRYRPLMTPMSVVEPSTNAIRTMAEQPDIAVNNLQSVLVGQAAATADTMGHIWYVQMMNEYTAAAQSAGEKSKAQEARNCLVELCHQRRIVPSVTREAERAVAGYDRA